MSMATMRHTNLPPRLESRITSCRFCLNVLFARLFNSENGFLETRNADWSWAGTDYGWIEAAFDQYSW
ncbi:hypothetical protein DXG03_008293 [Asterophora parasitica]|uniref:Uncharacterized protein n=1 Tax=Asterophora parasitica TaxID=117018 RepID=A0A9P7K8V8_9AGAR|nr:hypothetical protein DXG03_008293 [Asterophora parasitica]